MAIDKNINVNINAKESVSDASDKISDSLNKVLKKALKDSAADFDKLSNSTAKTTQALEDQVESLGGVFTDAFSEAVLNNRKYTESGELVALTLKQQTIGMAALAADIAIATIAIVGINALIDDHTKILQAATIATKVFNKSAAASKNIFIGISANLKNYQQQLKTLRVAGFTLATSATKGFTETVLLSRRTMLNIIKTTTVASTTLSGLGKATVSAAKHTELFEKGLSGTVLRAGLAAGALNLLGLQLLTSDSAFAKAAGGGLILLSVALGGFVLLVQQSLTIVGSLIQKIGTGLTEASNKQIEAFSSAEKNVFAFNQTIRSYAKSQGEATKSLAAWTGFVEKTSQATGTTTSSMQALVAETVAATEAAHLSTLQQEELIERTIDLSERAHKPAIDTLIALINGMNGASQSVVALGLHVNDQAIQHSKLDDSIKKNFKTLSDSEKAQARFSVLMDQAGKAAGFATENIDLYSKGLKLQENAQKSLNAELGRGAEIINGRVVFGLASATQALTDFAKPILPTIGFLQALGGRVLQVVGFLTKNFLMVGLLTSAYKALNVLLGKGFAGGTFAKTIAGTNKSTLQWAKSLGATTPKLNSLGEVAKSSFQIVKKQSADVVRSMLGLQVGAKITAKAFGQSLMRGLRSAAAGMKAFTLATLKFLATPIGLVLAGLVIAFFAVRKSIELINERSTILIDIWNDLKESFSGTSTVLAPLFNMFKQLAIIIGKGLSASLKVMAAGFAFVVGNVFRAILAFQLLSQVLPGSLGASDEAIAKTQERISELNKVAKQLALEGLSDVANIFFNTAEAATVSVNKVAKFTKELKVLQKEVEGLSEKAKDAFAFAAEFAPRIQLAKLTEDADSAEKTVKELSVKLKEVNIKIIDSKVTSPEIEKIRKELLEKMSLTQDALRGIAIKRATAERQAVIAEFEVGLQERKIKTISAEREIALLRIQSQDSFRQFEVDSLTAQLLRERGIRTASEREGISISMEARLQARSVELEAFTKNLEAQKTLAVSAESEKQLAILQIQANQTQGSGNEGLQAQADLETALLQRKIAEITQFEQNKVLTAMQAQASIEQAKLESEQRITQRVLEMAQQRSDALGNSPEAFAAQQEILLQQQEIELQNLQTKLERQLLTKQDFLIAEQELEIKFAEDKEKIRRASEEAQIDRLVRQGSFFQAQNARDNEKFRRSMAERGKIQAFFEDNRVKTVQSALGNIATLTNSSSRDAFEIGKKAAIADATVRTFQSAQAAFTSLAGIPIVGPALGVAAAAAAVVAGGSRISQIKSQKFNGGGGTGTVGAAPTGGQADEGLTSVPRSLDGRSFILSAGERVLNPNQNQDFSQAVEKINNGGSGATVNLTIQGNVDSQDTIERIKMAVMEGIRDASERGAPILSSEGVI